MATLWADGFEDYGPDFRPGGRGFGPLACFTAGEIQPIPTDFATKGDKTMGFTTVGAEQWNEDDEPPSRRAPKLRDLEIALTDARGDIEMLDRVLDDPEAELHITISDDLIAGSPEMSRAFRLTLKETPSILRAVRAVLVVREHELSRELLTTAMQVVEPPKGAGEHTIGDCIAKFSPRPEQARAPQPSAPTAIMVNRRPACEHCFRHLEKVEAPPGAPIHGRLFTPCSLDACPGYRPGNGNAYFEPELKP